MISLDITYYIFYIIKTRSMYKTFMLSNKFAAGINTGTFVWWYNVPANLNG